jgi:choline dehydrogenase-like flavoprotein
MSHHLDADVLIVGSGLMGAAVARRLRDEQPDLRILMVDGGPVIGSTPGQHLHDVPEPHIWQRYNQRVASGIQGFYTGTAPTSDVGATLVGVEPGMYHLSSIGQQAQEMPAAAVAWNVGGMGVHWTAATPTPWGEEVPQFLAGEQWDADLASATQMLRVTEEPFPPAGPGVATLEVLHRIFDGVSAPGRTARHMPMAVQLDEQGVRRRTGPNTIFAPVGDRSLDPHFTLLPGTQAVRLLHDGGEVRGVEVREVATGAHQELRATVTVVCADAIRTPQLLFASQIRPTALGRYLNEHAFLTGRVLTDLDRLGLGLDDLAPMADDEFMSEHLWVPHSGAEQPFHLQIGNQVHIDEDRRPLAYSVGLGFYVPTEIQADNRLEFSEKETDAAGMPRISVRFSYSDNDLRLIQRAREMQQVTADALGPFDPETESALLPAGSSLHFTGTVRMGLVDDGQSVCDTDGRVWGFDNLYVAGNGVLPTALACNSTLTGMVTAVRAARAVARQTGSGALTDGAVTAAVGGRLRA